MKIRIEPYKTWSGGAKALGKQCGILRATKRQVQKHGDFDVIINWGRNEKRFNGQYINTPAMCVQATNKLSAHEKFTEAGVPSLTYTVDISVANEWLAAGEHVVVRKLLRGSGGRGITLVGPPDSSLTSLHVLTPAPLYTKYFKKADEYRVHVAFGRILDTQQKKRKTEVPDEEVNWQIRNSSNGWIYARENVTAPECVTRAAVSAVSALGLDFGAVDIGFNRHQGTCAVFEVNTAPGLEGSTLDSYYTAFVEKFPALRDGMYRKRRDGKVRGGQWK